MKQLGLRGIVMLIPCSLLLWFLIRLGGGWEVFARVLLSILTGLLGSCGVYHVIAASFRKPERKCHMFSCSERSKRRCDFKMWNGETCDRPCCYQHIHIVDKMEYCESHYEGEGRP